MIRDSREPLWGIYNALDQEFRTRKDNSYEYLVNFSRIQDKPVHRWFYFQEGYSPQLVINVLRYLNVRNGNFFVFDPFAGSGTTLLTAKQLGMKSFGFEINPFSAFMVKVKTQNYDHETIRQLEEFRTPDYVTVPDVYEKYELRVIQNWFDKEKLEKIEVLKRKMKRVRNKKVKDLLFAALLSILEDVSNYRKGGNGLKRKRVIKDLDPFEEFRVKIDQICADLKAVGEGHEPTIINDSCLHMENYGINDIDISLFSPPYANCFDPFEVYKMELWIGEFTSSYRELRQKRRMALASNLSANLERDTGTAHRTRLLSGIIDFLSKQKLWDRRIPKMLDTYFYQMYTLMEKLYRLTTKGGFCVIVIGNSAYGNLVIPADIILAQIGKKVGFDVQEIIVARKNEASSQQYSKLGKFLEYMRESLVVLKK